MENIDRLIEILCNERSMPVPENLSGKDKADLFRALCNVRPPRPVTEEFIALQDEYLSQRTIERGVVNVNSFTYTGGIALWQGDITCLNADAIVNACNDELLGCFSPLHNCIDNIIHSNAGVQVRLECNDIMKGGYEKRGSVKVTRAYNLPSKYIFHTVGPIVYGGKPSEENVRDLRNCYTSCLKKADEMGLKTLAFCCISTGVYGYPKILACDTAVCAVRQYLSEGSKLNVVFNVFTDEDKRIYKDRLSKAQG